MEPLSEDEIIKNAKIVEKIIDGFKSPRRELVKKMFSEIGTQFFTSPASSRKDFHGCFSGGLADHSLRVIINLRKIAQALCPDEYDKDVLDFVGLVHDLGKIGDVSKPLYIVNPSEWHRDHGQLYSINNDLDFMTIEDRTIFLLQKFSIILTNDEFLAIKLSDGQYVESNRKYAMKETSLALLLHSADRFACQEEKTS
jgi:hypothetical protein